jgi:hypothetical protein
VDRHVPAAEIDHLRAKRAMGFIEDGLLGHACRLRYGEGIIAGRVLARPMRKSQRCICNHIAGR